MSAMVMPSQKIHKGAEISIPESRCEADEPDADPFRAGNCSPSVEGGAPGCFMAKRASRELARRGSTINLMNYPRLEALSAARRHESKPELAGRTEGRRVAAVPRV